ncbi:MAG TPA: gamma-glutamyltransferase [Thermoanaerobaculia bacterium]
MSTMTRLMNRTLSLLLLAPFLVPSLAPAAATDPVRARHGMVVSTSPIASEVGVEIMRRGGNAADAAVAVGFALAVTWPSAGNLGGGGFFLYRDADGKSEIVDYRERAPLAATRGMFLDENGKVVEERSTEGYLASGVPGTVAGLALAHRRHGRLPWADVVEPARKIASEGFIVPQHLARSLAGERTRRRLSKFAESRRIFLRDGKPWEAGERFVQPELAAVLARIQKDPRDFYEGETARLIAADMARNGGIITARDLAEYEPTLREPLRGRYRGVEVLTMPPPSSGGIALLQMLGMLESYDLASMGFGSADALHLLAEVMKRAFADRAKHLGDADFAKVPARGLVAREYVAKLGGTIDRSRATPSRQIAGGDPAPYESPETTHFAVVDAAGNIVANTYTLNDSYGSGVTVAGTGILLNDEMDDFTASPGTPNLYGLIQSEANAIEPQKRPLSSMTPTIVLRDGTPWFTVGSPGGPTIINTVLQSIVNVVDFGMDIQQAIAAPRIHHQWMPDRIDWEPYGMSPDTRRILERRGHVLADRASEFGDAQAIMIDPKTGVRLGGSDPRLGGAAVGY